MATTQSTRADLLPEITDLTAPYWDGLNEGKLRLQHCGRCGAYQYPPETFCYACGSTDVEWEDTSGLGTVYSFITVHQRYHSAFYDEVPYNVSVIELDEGPRVITNVVGIDPGEVTVGMRVAAAPKHVTESRSALFFERAG